MPLTISHDDMSVDTQTLDLEIPETNESIEINKNLITSTMNNSKDEESMPNMLITETPSDNQRKRRLDESGEEDLFQFQSKKPYNKSPQKTAGDDVDNEMPTTSKAEPNKNDRFSNFLQKTQTKSKNKSQTTSNDANKESRKRPHIQVLGENDEGGDNDEDLFSFGDTQKSKKSRPSLNEGEEEELFAFKDKETAQTKTVDVEDEDSTDMIPTQQFVVPEKPTKTKSSIQMPKPKILPRKVSAVDWLTGSMGKIKIKHEDSNLIKDEAENIIKTESVVKSEYDIELTDDHRKWLESLKDAIEIQQVSLNNTMKLNAKSHYRFKNRSNDNSTENLNGTTMKNFKTFVKVN